MEGDLYPRPGMPCLPCLRLPAPCLLVPAITRLRCILCLELRLHPPIQLPERGMLYCHMTLDERRLLLGRRRRRPPPAPHRSCAAALGQHHALTRLCGNMAGARVNAWQSGMPGCMQGPGGLRRLTVRCSLLLLERLSQLVP